MTKPSIAAMISDPREFRRGIMIDCDGEPKILDEVAEKWQNDDFEALDPGWRLMAGRAPGGEQAFLRAWLERPRGHSKTSDLSVLALWGLLAPRRLVRGVCLAADKDQGRHLINSMGTICRLNPELNGVVDVQRDKVINRRTGSEVSVIASDAATSYGLLVDFILADEISHWPPAGEDMWNALISTAGKRRCCLLVVISNAGTGQGTSWNWRAREAARLDPSWYFSRLDGPRATYITPDRIAEQKRLLPPSVFSRYWLNRWTTAAGDAFDESDIAWAFSQLPGPSFGFDPRKGPYVAGLDLSTRRDRTGLVVCCANHEQEELRIEVAFAKSWRPEDFGGRIPLDQVRAEVIGIAHRYQCEIVLDPWNAGFLEVDLVKAGCNAWCKKRISSLIDQEARTLLDVLRENLLLCYPHLELQQDLQSTSIVERPGHGFKLNFPRTSEGHADLASALSLCLPTAFEAGWSSRRPPVGITQVMMDGRGGFLLVTHQ